MLSMSIVRPEIVTSARNPLLKEIRRASDRGTLTPNGCMVAESFHLLEEALRGDCVVEAVVAAESVRSAVETHIKGLSRIQLYVVPDALFELVATTESPQGVVALVRPPQWNLDHLFRGRALVVLLDGLQDPGNAGSIVRAAEAFGASGVVFLKGSVSPYNTKTLRASAGSLFRMPFVAGLEPELALAAIEQKRLDLFATLPREGLMIQDADLGRRFAVAIGGEGRGVSAKIRAAAEGLRIPTTTVESLNAAVAASIVLYEAHRQRMLKP